MPLAALYDFKNGVNADRRAYGSGIPFINVLEPITFSHICDRDITGRVTLSDTTIAIYEVRVGDLVFNRTSEVLEEVGLAAAYLGKCCVVFGGFVIRARALGNAVDSKFAAYALRAPKVRSQIIAMGQGAVRANIGQSNLRRVLIDIPPSAEQQAIAAALSDADTLIDSLEQLLTKKRQIKQGAIQELLTGQRRLPGFSGAWPEIRLGSIGRTFGGLTGKSKADFGHGPARYITFMNVMRNVTMNPDITESVNVLPTESQNRVQVGDWLFNGSSETPAEVALCSWVEACGSDVYLNSFCFGFRPNDPTAISGLFMAYFFRARPGRLAVSSLAQGATRYNISKTALLQVPLSLPRMNEQKAIAQVLSDMDTDIAALEARLTKARDLKQAMAQALLTGRIRLLEPQT